MKKKTKSQIFKFDNTYVSLPKNFYQKINPVPVKKPTLIKLNHELLNFLDLDENSLKSNLGISILSTPKGVMSDQQAKKNNVGGEILCEVF